MRYKPMDFLGLSAVCFKRQQGAAALYLQIIKNSRLLAESFCLEETRGVIFYFSVPQAGVSQEELHGLPGRRLLLMAST